MTPEPELTVPVEYEIRSFTEEYNRDTSVREEWDTKTDYPPWDGYTYIENAGVYGLPPGVVINGKATRYGTAWTHQYHCLVQTYELLSYHVALRLSRFLHRSTFTRSTKLLSIMPPRHQVRTSKEMIQMQTGIYIMYGIVLTTFGSTSFVPWI